MQCEVEVLNLLLTPEQQFVYHVLSDKCRHSLTVLITSRSHRSALQGNDCLREIFRLVMLKPFDTKAHLILALALSPSLHTIPASVVSSLTGFT